MKLYFVQTCCACPEQYEVYRDNSEICCYIRLRWGCLSASYPDVGGESIYCYSFADHYMGCFNGIRERNQFLDKIAIKIKDRILKDIYDLDELENIKVEYEILNSMSELEERLHNA